MNNTNHVIFLSEFTKKIISKFLNKNIKYSIIPHGREIIKDEFIKNSWHLKKNINLLYISPILKYKNHEIVIKSYERLKVKYKNLKIKFIGKIHEKNLYRDLISKYKTINKENFLGEINHDEIKKCIKRQIFLFLHQILKLLE